MRLAQATKNYTLIVWWEDPRETFQASGSRRVSSPSYEVLINEACKLWEITGGIKISTYGGSNYETFWFRRQITVQLKRDPFKARNFLFKFDVLPGAGYGVLDFKLLLSPSETYTEANSFQYYDFVKPNRLMYRKTLVLPARTESLITHPLLIDVECSGQWDMECEARFSLEALLE